MEYSLVRENYKESHALMSRTLNMNQDRHISWMFYKTGHIVDVYIIDTCPVWFDISRIHMDKRSLRMDNNYCGQFERDIM